MIHTPSTSPPPERGSSPPPGALPRHPSDGPDLDVRARIAPEGVRLSIRVNLAFVDENTDFVRELEDHLDPVELAPLGEDLVAYFTRAVEVRVDGEPVAARLAEPVECLEGPQAMVPYFPVYGIRALTLVRVDLAYDAAEEPTSVALLWREFPPDLAQPMDDPPPMVVRVQLNDGTGDRSLQLTTEEPEYRWHGHVTTAAERLLPVVAPPAPATTSVPAPSLVLLAVALLAALALPFVRRRELAPRVLGGGLVTALFLAGLLLPFGRVEVLTGDAGAIDPRQAAEVFERLHANLYTAFDFDDRDEVYDALATCVAGDHLDQTFARVFRSLVLADDGGAVSRVQALRHLETEVESVGHLDGYGTDGFTVRSRWQVDGRVTHFGHTHERTQEYAARFAVGEVEGGWRILGDEMLEDFVVSARTVGG